MILGIFAGIGTGKSLVLDILEKKYFYKIIRADEVAKTLYKKDTYVYNKLIECFSVDILQENFEIDKNKLATLIFDDKENLDKLNSLVHPIVWDIIRSEIKLSKKKNIDLVVEAAILPSKDDISLYDKIFSINTDKEIRINRLKKNRLYTDEKIDKIFKIQISDLEYEKISDYIIYNNASVSELEKELSNILEKIKYENV